MNKNLTYLCIAAVSIYTSGYAIFDPVPGDQLWSMIQQIGLINETIAGDVIPIRAADIGATGITISQPGNYGFIQDVTYTAIGLSPAPAISITASNVSLDLNHFTLSTSNNLAVLISIASNVSNVVIRSAYLNSGLHGIQLLGGNSYIVFADIQITDAGREGILIASNALNIIGNQVQCINNGYGSMANSYNGITINGSSSNIAFFNSIFLNNKQHGIEASGNFVTFAKCTANANGGSGFLLSDSTNLSIADCTSSNHADFGFSLVNCNQGYINSIATTQNSTAGLNCNGCTNLAISNFTSDRDNNGTLFADNYTVNLTNLAISRSTNQGMLVNGDTGEFSSIYSNIAIHNAGSTGIDISSTCTQILIENTQIFQTLAQSAPNDGYGIAFLAHDYYSVTIRDVEIFEAANTGIYFDSFTISGDILVDDCHISNSAYSGQTSFYAAGGISFATSTSRSNVRNCQVLSNNGVGITFNNTGDSIGIYDCISINHNQHGIAIDALAAATTFTAVTIENCYVISNTLSGIIVAGVENGRIVNNTVVNNALSTTDAANGITAGTSTAGLNFVYIGFNDLVFNNAAGIAGHFNLQNWGNMTYSGNKHNGMAGNFAVNSAYAYNYDTTNANLPSAYNAIQVDVDASGSWPAGAATSRWQALDCKTT